MLLHGTAGFGKGWERSAAGPPNEFFLLISFEWRNHVGTECYFAGGLVQGEEGAKQVMIFLFHRAGGKQ